MSDYTGPGTYTIIPMNARDKSLNLWGGGNSKPGTQIKLYPKDPVSNNTVWEIAAAGGKNGQPESGDREYHILSVSSGLYVTCSETKAAVVTGEIKSCLDPSVRYKLQPAGNGAYYINCVNGEQLNVKGGASTTGTDIISWSAETGANAQFILKVAPV